MNTRKIWKNRSHNYVRFLYLLCKYGDLVSNLFIIFLVLIFRNRKVMFGLGLPLLVGFVILICVRMIFPVELLPISHNVYLPDLLATIVGETRRVRFFHDTVSWWNIFEIVMGLWLLIFIVQIHQT